MRDASACLSIHHHRIDLHAVIMQRDIAQDAHTAGFNIHLYLGGVAGIGIGEMIAAKRGERFQPGREPRRESIARSAAQ